MTRQEALDILQPYIDENSMYYADDYVMCADDKYLEAFKIAVDALKSKLSE